MTTEPYTAYAALYDEIKGDRSDVVAVLRRQIELFKPGAKQVLEIACGTGAVMADLKPYFTMSGLDASAAMLDRARQKLPHAAIRQGTMQDFSFDTPFDAIYCVHNSVNHLPDLAAWESTLASVAAQLAPGGVFIFDINPPDVMATRARRGFDVTEVGKHVAIAHVTQNDSPNSFIWHMRIFRHQTGDTYKLYHEETPITVFPEAKLEAAVRKHFDIVNVFLDPNSKAGGRERPYYVCIKV